DFTANHARRKSCASSHVYCSPSQVCASAPDTHSRNPSPNRKNENGSFRRTLPASSRALSSAPNGVRSSVVASCDNPIAKWKLESLDRDLRPQLVLQHRETRLTQQSSHPVLREAP